MYYSFTGFHLSNPSDDGGPGGPEAVPRALPAVFQAGQEEEQQPGEVLRQKSELSLAWNLSIRDF